ncbi:MAG: glycosyltransferase [Fimbriimonadaceae bacterium]|nr:glycosyltransferase [Fimbriimonadaceae bacterium]
MANPNGRRVALIHDWLTVPAGSEAVFAEVCALFPGTVFASQIDAERCTFLRPYPLRPSAIQKLPFALTKHWLYAPVLPNVYAGMDLSEFDLVLSDSHSFAHGVRRAPGALHVNYYHTPARSLWVPEIDPRAGKTWLHRMIAKRLKRLDFVASKRPDVIFTNSETTAARVRKFYGREVDQVIYPPVHTEAWLKVPRKSTDAGLITWGRLIGYKRVDLAIESVRRTGQALHVVGSGPLEAELRAQAADCPNITFHGRLGDAELMELMAHCKAFVFPAYEDFGIVAVEAMAAGLPVVAFAEGGASETVRDEFGVRFPEQSVDALVAALEELDRREFDEQALREHAKQYDVSVFRREYRKAVDAAIEKHFGDSKPADVLNS